MKFSTQALLRQGKLEVLAKTGKMSSRKRTKKTIRQQNERFLTQYKDQYENRENVLRVGFDAETNTYYEKN